MRTAIDTNVFSLIWLGGNTAPVASRLLLRCRVEGSLVISPTVYAEMLANATVRESTAIAFQRENAIRVDWELSEAVWTEAGRRFRRYAERRRASGGGEARRLLADFIVGAHALVQADRLLTFDVRRYQVDFPDLVLVQTGMEI